MIQEIETKDGYVVRGTPVATHPLKNTVSVRMSNGKIAEGRLKAGYPLL